MMEYGAFLFHKLQRKQLKKLEHWAREQHLKQYNAHRNQGKPNFK
jgi:hypothetical protein